LPLSKEIPSSVQLAWGEGGGAEDNLNIMSTDDPPPTRVNYWDLPAPGCNLMRFVEEDTQNSEGERCSQPVQSEEIKIKTPMQGNTEVDESKWDFSGIQSVIGKMTAEEYGKWCAGTLDLEQTVTRSHDLKEDKGEKAAATPCHLKEDKGKKAAATPHDLKEDNGNQAAATPQAIGCSHSVHPGHEHTSGQPSG